MRYTNEQIGETKIRTLNTRSKDTYALYVDQGDIHEPVLIGSGWEECRNKTAQLIRAGVSEHDIYGETDQRTGEHWGQARMHLWLPSQK